MFRRLSRKDAVSVYHIGENMLFGCPPRDHSRQVPRRRYIGKGVVQQREATEQI